MRAKDWQLIVDFGDLSHDELLDVLINLEKAGIEFRDANIYRDDFEVKIT